MKERFTVLLAASATGEKEKIWIIRKSAKPDSFPKPFPKCFMFRSNNARGWMTTEIFVEFLNYLNNKMKRQNRNIILLLDNCPSHPDIKLSNIKLVFLPKNTTSELQPLDTGVIAWLKSYYKRLLMTQLRAMKDSKDIVNWSKVTIYAAVANTKDSWKEMPAETIVKCFKKCGIHSHIFENNNQTDETPVIRESDEFDRSCRDHSGLWQKKST